MTSPSELPPQDASILAWAREHKPHVVSSFLSGRATPHRFEAGTQLTRAMTRGYNKAVSDFFGLLGETKEMLRRAGASSTDPSMVFKARLALRDDFNPDPNFVAIITLTADRWGLIGPTGPQKTRRNGPDNVVWIGGSTQAWIPGIGARDCTVGKLWKRS